ncbi:hypothetical protein [Tenacibaculum finnmarkense]|uniref:hypothetical protein n=1 Tax=Tenacibaculum finnmarkense TaxID=2781243 RepID=UPI001E4E2FF2|nr:hypothetical protein [Tenacibaculum finnmarkense]MCD8409778.1 hypothetical protein [Tenacibaculum finnmarkense genomovar ulcerans]MCG8901679.1 hypothetical protein [Tenacibaculum finnmarkense]
MEIKNIRLNKVLRELNISLDRAVDSLAKKGLKIEARPTAKITEKEYSILKEEFKPTQQKSTGINIVGKIDLDSIPKSKKKPISNVKVDEPIINNYKTLLATRIVTNARTVGYVRPEYSFFNNFQIIQIDKVNVKEFFPNGGSVIVPYNFHSDIEDVFDENELFKIEYEETNSYDETKDSSPKYQSSGRGTSSISKLPLIINEDLNKVIEEGVISLPYKNHSFVFIEDNNKIFGPLAISSNFTEEDLYEYIDEDDNKLYEYKVQSLLTKNLGLSEDYQDVIHEFDTVDLKEYIVNKYYFNRSQRKEDFYITNIKHLLKEVEPVNLILNESNEKIIKIIEASFPEKEDESKLLKGGFNEINKLRYQKFLKIKEGSEKVFDFIKLNILPSYLQTDLGKEYVDSYINRNKEGVIQDKIEELKKEAEIKAKKDLEEIQFSIEFLKEEKEDLTISVDKNKIEKKKLEFDLQKLSNEKESIIENSKELASIEKSIFDKKQELKIVETFETLKNTIEEKEHEEKFYFNKIQKLEEDKKTLEEQITEIKKDLVKESEEDIYKKIREIRPYFELMNGSYSEQKENENNFPLLIDEELELTTINTESLEVIIEDLKMFLQHNGRSYKKEEILNFIILYIQNFLIIFSGLPGIGKTSLSNLLSEFFTHKNCYLEMAVSKGWNSRKVLLGYNNPINETYQFDEFGFVKKIISYNKTPINLPLNILLDEANLSPIEYYWSDFISLYDKDKDKRNLKLDLKSHNILKIPDLMRFMATINNDHTTERLSPRLIDRAPIITLESDNTLTFDTVENINYQSKGFYDFKELEKFFNSKDVSLLSKEKEILGEIFKTLKNDGSILISRRKIKSITKYCNISRELMSKYTSNQYSHIDFAIAQFVLPQILGQGKSFEKMLDDLLELLIKYQLFKSSKIVKKIKEKGSSFQVFTFFN